MLVKFAPGVDSAQAIPALLPGAKEKDKISGPPAEGDLVLIQVPPGLTVAEAQGAFEKGKGPQGGNLVRYAQPNYVYTAVRFAGFGLLGWRRGNRSCRLAGHMCSVCPTHPRPLPLRRAPHAVCCALRRCGPAVLACCPGLPCWLPLSMLTAPAALSAPLQIEMSDDPYLVSGALWNMNGAFGISAPDAWDTLHECNGVYVGVVDTGIDATHIDLKGNIDTDPLHNCDILKTSKLHPHG